MFYGWNIKGVAIVNPYLKLHFSDFEFEKKKQKTNKFFRHAMLFIFILQEVLVWLTALQKELGGEVSDEKMRDYIWNTLKSGRVRRSHITVLAYILTFFFVLTLVTFLSEHLAMPTHNCNANYFRQLLLIAKPTIVNKFWSWFAQSLTDGCHIIPQNQHTINMKNIKRWLTV